MTSSIKKLNVDQYKIVVSDGIIKLEASDIEFEGYGNFVSTGAVKIPVGDTLSRPSSPSTGMIRYNTTLATYEGFDGASWSTIGTDASTNFWKRLTVIDDGYILQPNDKIIGDTSGGSFSVELPASPTLGTFISIADNNTWNTNNLTVLVNGNTIESIFTDLVLDMSEVKIELIWDGTTWQLFSIPISTENPDDTLDVINDITTTDPQYLTFIGVNDEPVNSLRVSDTRLYFVPSTGTLSATQVVELSDATFKTNIESIPNGLDIVKQLQGVKFDWINNGNTSYGVVAQELEKILPHLVVETNGVKSVNYSGLIPFLIESIKELESRLSK